jgi:predicted AlkP superfamily phosphohydrolase/phosphomutase
MVKHRVLAICLDGFEASLAERMMRHGELPALRAMQEHSASRRLDHGPAQRTGLAGEHLASGLSPEDSGRWAAVSFNPATYSVIQEGTRMTPFTNGLSAKTVVFDAPYFHLKQSPDTLGLVNWGAHDPGVPTGSNPDDLIHEFNRKIGPYPAKDFIYALPWPSPERCRQMGESLSAAVDLRSKGARWLLQERFPDWDLALVVVSEPHSAIEGLWHGVDPEHPLHCHPSSTQAGEGLCNVYRAVDRLIGDLLKLFPEATLLVFSMGGMGRNESDVASMVLLSELLFRESFGSALLKTTASTFPEHAGLPVLAPDANWHQKVKGLVAGPRHVSASTRLSHRLFREGRQLSRSLMKVLQFVAGPTAKHTLDWMPATLYQPYWASMRAFALPSFYDGRIRINLKGRERFGLVDPADYHRICEEIIQLLHECRDSRTGGPAVSSIERQPTERDPCRLGDTESDLVVVWNGPLGLVHPHLGTIGPIPYRRSGGHTGPHGVMYLRGPGIRPGSYPDRSSFDLVPTLLDLLDQSPSQPISGRSMLAEMLT